MKIEAQVTLAKCKTGQTYGIRMEKMDSDWKMTWAFPIDEKKALSEGYNRSKITGCFSPIANYNGCPFCGAKQFMLCSDCGHLSCYQVGASVAKCYWCGNSGAVSTIDKVTLTSGEM